MTTPPDTMPDEVWISPHRNGWQIPKFKSCPYQERYLRADLATAREAALMACIAGLADAVVRDCPDSGMRDTLLEKYATIIFQAKAQAQTKGGKDGE